MRCRYDDNATIRERSMKRFTPWSTCLLLLLLALSLQGCLGSGGNNNQVGNTITTNSNGNKDSVAQNLFKGKIYFTIDHNLLVTDTSGPPRALTPVPNLSTPTISPV